MVAHPSPAFSFATVDTIDYCDVTASNVYCSDDSWRDTFFEKHEHSTLWLLICGTIEKHLLTYKRSIYWHCSCGMQSRVNDTIVCLSRHDVTTAAACNRFAAERHADGSHQPTVAGAHQQLCCSTALSSKCEQCHFYSWCRKLNTDWSILLLYFMCL